MPSHPVPEVGVGPASRSRAPRGPRRRMSKRAVRIATSAPVPSPRCEHRSTSRPSTRIDTSVSGSQPDLRLRTPRVTRHLELRKGYVRPSAQTIPGVSDLLGLFSGANPFGAITSRSVSSTRGCAACGDENFNETIERIHRRHRHVNTCSTPSRSRSRPSSHAEQGRQG